MFVKAIEEVSEFTRPIQTISRLYGDKVVDPGLATLFFVNEDGCAVTCKHVAQLLISSDQISSNYSKFKEEEQKIGHKKHNQRLRELEQQYNYSPQTIIQLKTNFVGCTSDEKIAFRVHFHPDYDLAIIVIEGANDFLYTKYARFLKDDSAYMPGSFLCRLGYPFPEFSNFQYNGITDDIEWTKEGVNNMPKFPIEGMLTRGLLNGEKIVGFEMSTPGLRGQSGGPVFNKDGIIYGMQVSTNHLHLGFDLKNFEYKVGNRSIKVTNQPFLHVGNCLRADIIKEFLKQHDIKFYEA